MVDYKTVLGYIESHHWDVEESYVPKSIEFVHDDEITMMSNRQSTSIYANKIVKFRPQGNFTETIDKVYKFYGHQPFAWWVGPQDHPDLLDYLTTSGWSTLDKYEGLAIRLEDWDKQTLRHKINEVVTEDDISDLTAVSARVWGYDEQSRNASINEIKAYLDIPNRRGNYFVIYKDDIPVAYGNDRLSEDGKALYLKGSAVLSSQRRQGYYSDLVRHRLNIAKEKGVEWVTVQGRKGTSEPILKKLGFKSYGMYYQLVKKQS